MKHSLSYIKLVVFVAIECNRLEPVNDMAEKQVDSEFVEFVVKALVDHPENVEVSRTVDEMGVLITLKVHPEDMGQIIGRQGQNARSLRTLLRVVGAKHNARVNLKIYEPEGDRPRRFSRENTQDSDVDTSAVDDIKI